MKYILLGLICISTVFAKKPCPFVKFVKNVGRYETKDGEIKTDFAIWKIGGQCYIADSSLPSSWGMAWTPCPGESKRDTIVIRDTIYLPEKHKKELWE